MKSLKYFFPLAVITLLVPLFAYAQTNFTTIITMVGNLIRLLIPIAIAAALLFFIWGLAVFIKNSGDEDGLKEGKQKMLWGVIALFVIISIWGLVALINSSFRLNPGEKAPVPDIPRSVR